VKEVYGHPSSSAKNLGGEKEQFAMELKEQTGGS